jgi:hypothetical protein
MSTARQFSIHMVFGKLMLYLPTPRLLNYAFDYPGKLTGAPLPPAIETEAAVHFWSGSRNTL